MCTFRRLLPHEIDVRIGQAIQTTKWQGVSLLLYKNARVDMDILDESVGSTNWQRYHEVVNGNLYCTVSIWDEAKGQWIAKSDCGVESNTEKEKGEASDAFKRACVNWGIGRELYTAPKDMLISCELDEKKKPKDKKLKFYVSHIAYEGTKITELTIVNQDGESLYNFPKKGANKPPQNTPKTPPKTNDKPKVVETITRSELVQKYGVENPEKTILWLEGKVGKEIANFDEDDTAWARAQLEAGKKKRDAEKRKAALERVADDDLPFPLGDE
jgi:hypothetical protein